MEPTTLIRTKLNRPRVASDLVERPRLVGKLNRGLERKLALVAAPAGYGKSTLVAEWLETCEQANAWLSLDENDSDLVVYLNYFIAAVQSVFPEAGRETTALLHTPELPPLPVLTSTLINDLDHIEQPFILVLDDYHLIHDLAVHNLMDELLRHPPRTLHLVLISRLNPPLKLSRLRARGQMVEIRVQDMRFTEAETSAFVRKTMGASVDQATAALLQEKTEGWVTGLRLAALSMRHRGDIDPKLLEPHVDTQYVLEYLFNEVFCRLPPEVSQYLLGTALLERFCGPLCEAVCVPGVDPLTCELRGWDFIAWLKRENVFLISLDPEGRWFRFHKLFQKLLRNQLKRQCNADEISTFHRQASAWFVENGLIEEGLRHALAAGDTAKAARLIARHGHQLMNDQQWPQLQRWLDMLPRDRIEQEQELLLLEAWLYHIRQDLSNMVACLKKIEILGTSSPPGPLPGARYIQGHLEALRGFQHFMAADGENALTHLRRACEHIPAQHKRARVFAHIFQLGAYQMVGDLATGMSIYQDQMSDCLSQDPNYHVTYLANLCLIYWMDANLVAMRQTAETALNAARHHLLPSTRPLGFYFLGIFHYHRNELKIAAEKLAENVEKYYAVSPMNFAHSAFALALAYQAREKPGKASKICDAVIAHAVETSNADMLQVARAFEAELAFRQGRLAEALHWAAKTPRLPLRPVYRFYMPQLTRIQLLLAEGTTDSRQAAAELLEQTLTFFRSIHNRRFQIDLLALQALLHDSQENEPAALKSLTEALAIAEPGGFIRLFVDLGPQMADLLKRLQKQNVAANYIAKLLAAFSPPCAPQRLAEPMTHRELDVLELLAQRLSNQEIADKLFVSSETVKGHLKNIYHKLDVGKRREAVEKAMHLGILSQR